MWYNEYGKDGDVVLSSRVRLARNFRDIPFPCKEDEKEQNKVIDLCKDFIVSSDKQELKDMKLKLIDLSQMKVYEKQAIAECHLISPQMINNDKKRALILSDDSRISIMINEEDHLRIQCMETGFDIDKCFLRANQIDDAIEEKIDYAFDEDFGYLTACPTNVGTGLRASVMVHLPGYVMTGKFSELNQSLSQLGLTVRGIYGEGTKGLGNIFQISNQLTLGLSEEDIIERLKQIVSEVISNERELRKNMHENNKFKLEDRIMRSVGALRYAVVMTSKEAMEHISDARLGVALKLIDDISFETLNELTYSILPANIIKNYNTSNDYSRDIKRAEIIKERMC